MARMMYLVLPQAVVSFTATGTIQSAVDERHALRRKGLIGRLSSGSMVAYFAYTVGVLAALGSVGRNGIGMGRQCTGAVVRLVECLYKVSVPLRYMAFPPSVPERRELMAKDASGVYRPKRKYSLEVSARVTWLDMAEVATMIVLDWM
jgi:hypothetical protein